MLAPVCEPVARPPLLVLARTCTIGSQIAPVVSPTDWHAAWALHAAPRPAPQPPCAHTALEATAFYSRRHPRWLANSPFKKANQCLQHFPMSSKSISARFTLFRNSLSLSLLFVDVFANVSFALLNSVCVVITFPSSLHLERIQAGDDQVGHLRCPSRSLMTRT